MGAGSRENPQIFRKSLMLKMVYVPLTPKDELFKLGGSTGASPALQGAGTPQRGNSGWPQADPPTVAIGRLSP